MAMDDTDYLYLLDRAVLARKHGKLDRALKYTKAAVHARPDQAAGWHGYATSLEDYGRWSIAVDVREQAMELLLKSAPLQELPEKEVKNLALALGYSGMRLGRFENALPLFECGRIGTSWDLFEGTRRWQGQADGKLLVKCEGGYGDVFLFSRWLPLVRERLGNGTNVLGLVVFQGLKGLFAEWESQLGVDVVYSIGERIDCGFYDYSISMMSLPAVFGMKSWSDIPPPARGALGPSKTGRAPVTRIGFCWRAEESGVTRKTRTLDDATAQAVVDALPGKVHSLCPYSKYLYVKDDFTTPRGVAYDSAAMASWRATAEYIAGMDYVVTVDTAVAHLAGLLGVPTMVLLPVCSDWKWGVDTDTSVWYPQMKLYRETNPLGWSPAAIVESILKELK